MDLSLRVSLETEFTRLHGTWAREHPSTAAFEHRELRRSRSRRKKKKKKTSNKKTLLCMM
jgi:hypothetical protein